jgi:hypothetical protein
MQGDANLTLNYSYFAIPSFEAKIHTIGEVVSEVRQLVIARAIACLGTESIGLVCRGVLTTPWHECVAAVGQRFVARCRPVA